MSTTNNWEFKKPVGQGEAKQQQTSTVVEQ